MECAGLLGYTLWAELHDKRIVHEAQAEASLPVTASDHKEMKSRSDVLFQGGDGEYAVYFLQANAEQQPFLYNSKSMQSASMIKLFILAKAMQDIHDGRLSYEAQVPVREADLVDGAGILNIYHVGETRSIGNLLNIMITESDNTATNILIDQLGGMNTINAYIQKHGYADTILQHKMMIANGGLVNLTSVKDVGTLLFRIYRRECVGEKEDSLMEDMLLGQKDRECFPTALGDWKIAHKTGEITGSYHDGGILHRDGEDLILVLMSTNWRDRADAMMRLRQAAQYFALQTKTTGSKN